MVVFIFACVLLFIYLLVFLTVSFLLDSTDDILKWLDYFRKD